MHPKGPLILQVLENGCGTLPAAYANIVTMP
jgi:hypothetical protein